MLNQRETNTCTRIEKESYQILVILSWLHAIETASYLIKICEKNSIEPIVWSSKYTRAQQTAEPFLTFAKRNYNVDKDLREYSRVGRTFPDWVTPDESWESFCQRVFIFAKKLKELDQSETYIIFGHSLFFSVLLSYLSTQEEYEFCNKSFAIHLPNCSISTIKWCKSNKFGDGDHWEIYNVGFVGHLREATGTHTAFGCL